MAREKIKGAVTASGSTESDKIIGNIDTIVGKISNAEELSVNNLENISKTLDAKLLDTIVSNSNSLKEYAVTQANMLMGITGYLLGNTGINKTSDFGSLKGSIKNTEPLFVSPTDTLNGFYDMLTELINNTGISGGASGGASSTLNVVLNSVDGGNLDSLIDLIKEVQKAGNVKNVEVLTAIEGVLKKLDKIGKMEIDTELLAMKMDDVQLAMFNIGETFNELSNLERRMNGIDIKAINTGFNTLSKFDFAGNFKNIQDLIGFINNVAELKIPKNINKNISENTSRITEFIKVLVPFYTEMEKVPKVNYKRLIKNITNNVNRLPMLVDALNGIELKGFNKAKIKELQAFREVLYSFFYVLDDITYFEDIDVEDALDVLKDDILPHFTGKDGLVDRISGLDFKKFNKSTIKEIINFSFAISSFGDVLKTISKMTPTMIWLTMVEDTVFDGFNLVYNMTYWLQEIVEQMKVVNKKAGVLVTFNGVMSTLAEIFKSLFKFSIFAMMSVGLTSHIEAGIKILNMISTELDNLNVDDIKDKQEIVHSYKLFIDDLLSVLAKVPLVGIFGLLAVVFEKPLSMAINTLNKIITTINEKIQVPELNASIENLKPYATLIKDLLIVFGAVTIVGILAAPAIIGGLLLAAAVKVIFVVLSKAFESIKANVVDKKTHEALDSMTRLIIIMSGLMLVAALVGLVVIKFFANIMAFLGVFLIFLASITLVITLIGGLMQLMNAVDAVKTMATLGNLIQTLTIIMIIGALFMLTGLWKESLQFGAVLAGFIFLVMLPFVILGTFFKSAIKGAKEIATLIITCTLVMMLGALFMLSGLHWHALGFGALLAVFIFLIVLPFVFLIKMGGRKALKAVDDIKQLVITCTIILVLGALLMMIPGFAVNATLFALIIAGFVFLIVGTFALMGKKLQKAMGAMWGIMAIMVVSTFVLMLGANYVAQYGWEPMTIFGTILVSFIGVIGTACVILGKYKKDLMKGLLAMACIVGISMLFGITLKMVADAVNLADPLQMLAAVGVIATIIIAIGGLSVALGALASIPPVSMFFWAGIAACAAVAGIAVLLSVAIKNIAVAAKLIAEASNMGFEIDGALAIVGGMVAVGQAVGAAGLALPLGLIAATSRACTSMAIMISKIGKAVADISNLTVATAWDAEGNPTSYRQLNESDFQKAADNTKTIISVLGDAIIEIYNKKPEMFKAPVITSRSWFKTTQKQGKTPFEMVCTSCASMGNMISLIGKGVAEMADLKVAVEWSSDGTPTKYRHLQESDFKLAADNISKIVSTVGTAIIGIYDKNPKMFEVPMITQKTWWGGTRKVSNPNGKTTFEKVVTACSSMGNMITMIAQGVRDFATMSYASKWNSDGVPIEYTKLTDGDVKNAISNIYRTVLCTFDALMRVYNWDPAFFDTKIEFQDGYIVAKNPVFSVIRAGMAMGRMISSLAQGVSDIANLRVATKWNKDGVAIDYRPFTETDFENYDINVKKILTASINAVKAAYEIDPSMFDSVKVTVNGLFTDITYTKDSPIKSVVTACQGLGVVISEIAKGVSDIINLHLVDADGNKVALDPTDIEPNKGKFYVLTRDILCAIPRAAKQAYDLCPDGTATAVDYFNNLKDKVKDIVTSYIEVVKIVKEKAADIDDFDEDIDNSLLYKKIRRIIACIPRASRYAYDLCPGGTEESIKYFDRLKDKVKNIVTSYAECIIEAKDKVKDISDFDDDLDNSILYKRIKGIIASIPRAAKFAFDLCPKGTEDAIKYFNRIDNQIENIIDTYPQFYKTINETISTTEVDDASKTWAALITGVFTPFDKIKDKALKNAIKFSKISFKNSERLIRSINTLDSNKVDKFIELTDQLKDLSLNVEDMAGFIEALNGRINDTLNTVSKRLLQSVAALERSDKAQEKRNKMIKENTAELKKVLRTPLTIKVKTEDDTSSSDETSSSSSAAISGGTGEGSGDVGTPAANCGTGSISSDDFEKLAGTASEILGILKNHFGDL